VSKTPESITVLEAKRRLQLYNEKVEEIRALSFREKVFIENHGITMHFNFETQEPVKFEKRGSTREATLALVSLLRLFLQPRDKISLWEIADLYERLPVPAEDSTAVRRVVDGVDAYLDEPTSGIALVFNSEKITNRKFFELMMYGDLAHVNVEKRAEYEKFIKPGLPFYETLFEQMVARLLNVIWSFPETNKRSINALEALPDSQIL
jgi:hypothetical protein